MLLPQCLIAPDFSKKSISIQHLHMKAMVAMSSLLDGDGRPAFAFGMHGGENKGHLGSGEIRIPAIGIHADLDITGFLHHDAVRTAPETGGKKSPFQRHSFQLDAGGVGDTHIEPESAGNFGLFLVGGFVFAGGFNVEHD